MKPRSSGERSVVAFAFNRPSESEPPTSPHQLEASLMNGFAKLARSVFPLAMVVVCSSIYFVYFENERSQTISPGPNPTPPPPSSAVGPKQLETLAAVPQASANVGSNQRIEAHSETEADAIVLAAAADTPSDAAAVRRATSDSSSAFEPAQTSIVDLELAPPVRVQQTPPSTGTASPVSNLAASAERSTSAPPAPTDMAPSESSQPLPVTAAPAVPENVVANRHYESTRVNDYWVGLARARGETAVPAATNIDGVVVNSYFSAAAPTMAGSAPAKVAPQSQSNPSSIPLAAERTSVVESAAARSAAEFYSPPAEPAPAVARPVWSEPQPMPQTMPMPQPQPGAAWPTESDVPPGPIASNASQLSQPSEPTLPPVSDHVRQKLFEHWEYGGSLARRNATRLAKQEFFSGLSLLAEHADQCRGVNEHLAALRQGFLAMEEVADFDSNSQLRQTNVQVITQKHETPLIRDGFFTTDSHAQARTAYLLYAQSRIQSALARQTLAGELLYSLGKLSLANYEFHSKTDNLEFMRATVLFECALAINPEHEKSANELAVIRAKSGDWQAARQLLQQAVVLRPEFLEAWQNLTKVHQRMGEPDLARLAAAQVEFLSQAQPEQGSVRMVSNQEFAATAAAMDGNDEMVGQPTPPGNDDAANKRPRLFPSLR